MASTKPRKRRGDPTKPREGGALGQPTAWTPGQRPAWLDVALASVLPNPRRKGPGAWCQGIRDLLVGQVAGTGSVDRACDMAGVHPVTVKEWLQRGHVEQQAWEKANAAGEDPGPVTEHMRFVREIRIAHGWWAGRHVARLEAAAEAGDLAVTQWLLTHMGPKIAAERVEHSMVDHRQRLDECADDVDAMLDAMVERRAKARA